MSTFDEFNKKEKPVFTGSRFGFGAGAAAPSGPSLPDVATGGTKYTYNSKTIHVFTTTGANTFIAPKNFNAEVFVVAGGGGGATDMAGGGGAGGVRDLSSVPIPSGTHVVTVGAGGYGSNRPYPGGTVGNPDTSLRQGNNSSIGSIVIATGGGAGGWETGDATTGGSGGGCHGRQPMTAPTVASPDGISPTAQGKNGGTISGTFAGGAGGGGWNDVGQTDRGGNGDLCPPTFRDPSNPYGRPGPANPSFYFAGGGGAGKYQANGNNGGVGGGGPGGNSPGAPNGPKSGDHGYTNTGGGGGGGASHSPGPGGDGGSGIVFIAYPTPTFP